MLRSSTEERHLAPRPMAILELLGNRRGAVVSKEEIFEQVWRDAVVEDGVLPRCMSQIRGALGDDARNPRYIRTIPKKGYRLIAQVEAIPAEPAAAAAPAARRWWPAAAAAIGLILVLVIAASRLREPTPGTAPDDPQRTIAVLGIADLSDHPEAGWLATALAEMLTTELAVSSRLRTIPEDTVALMKRQLSVVGVPKDRTLDRLRRHLGVDLGVVGTFWITPVGERRQAGGTQPGTRSIRLDLQVMTGEPPEILAAVVVTGTVDELADLILLAGLRLRESLGVGGRLANESRLAAEPGPVDPTAARLYYQGLEALRRLDARAAVDLLERSRQADPANPHIQSALARGWSTLGYDARARAAAGAALQASADLPREQRLWTEARSYAVNREWPEAIERLRALWLLTAGNLEYGHELARAQLDADRPQDARLTLAEIRERSGDAPRDPRIALATGEVELKLGELNNSLEAAAESLELAREFGATLVSAQALTLRARALHALGQSEEAESALQEAAGIFVNAGDLASEARTQATLARWLENRGEDARAEALERTALESFVRVGDRAGEATVLRRLAGHVWTRQGAAAGQAMLERAITISRDAGDRAGEAASLNDLAINNAIHGVGPVVPLFEQALDLYREIGDQKGISDMLSNLGRSALLRGNLLPAIERFGEAETLSRQLGIREGLATTLFNLGYTKSPVGDVAGATRAFREALEIFRETKNPRMVAASLEGLADARLHAGDAVAARAHLEESLDLRIALEDESRLAASKIVLSLTALARVGVVEGDLAGAQQLARRALAQADTSDYPPRRRSARLQLAEVLLASGHPAAARTAIDELMEEELPTFNLTAAQNQVTMARVLGAAGDRTQALRLLDQVAAFATEKGADRLRLEAELARLELAQSAGERLPELEEIRRQAQERGLHWIASRARELMVSRSRD